MLVTAVNPSRSHFTKYALREWKSAFSALRHSPIVIGCFFGVFGLIALGGQATQMYYRLENINPENFPTVETFQKYATIWVFLTTAQALSMWSACMGIVTLGILAYFGWTVCIAVTLTCGQYFYPMPIWLIRNTYRLEAIRRKDQIRIFPPVMLMLVAIIGVEFYHLLPYLANGADLQEFLRPRLVGITILVWVISYSYDIIILKRHPRAYHLREITFHPRSMRRRFVWLLAALVYFASIGRIFLPAIYGWTKYAARLFADLINTELNVLERIKALPESTRLSLGNTFTTPEQLTQFLDHGRFVANVLPASDPSMLRSLFLCVAISGVFMFAVPLWYRCYEEKGLARLIKVFLRDATKAYLLALFVEWLTRFLYNVDLGNPLSIGVFLLAILVLFQAQEDSPLGHTSRWTRNSKTNIERKRAFKT